MNQFQFTKKESQIAKGVAILFMIYHHLFSYNRLPKEYLTFLPKSPINLLSTLSAFGTICVSIFVILTGIGLFYISQKKDFNSWCIKHSFAFILHYWLVFILVVPIGFIFFNQPFYWNECVKNFFLLSYSYNYEWWFLRVYLEILLFAPWIIHGIKKTPKRFFLFSLTLSMIGYLLHESSLYNRILVKEFSTFLLWQLIFCIGYYIAYYKIFEYLHCFIDKYNLNKFWFSLSILSLCVIIRQMPFITSKLKDPFLAPIVLFFSVCLIKQIKVQTMFYYLGKHSFNMWLVHTFFCYYYGTNLVLLPKISLFIFIWLTLLSFATSYIINAIELQILKGLKKWNKNITSPYVIY